MTTHFVGDTALLTGRSLRHITRSLDTYRTYVARKAGFLTSQVSDLHEHQSG